MKLKPIVENQIFILKQIRKMYEGFVDDDQYARITVNQINERLKELERKV